MDKLWKSFKCPSSELNLNIILACGQSFRWLKVSEEEWIGVAGKRLWILRQAENSIFFRSYGKNTKIHLQPFGHEISNFKKTKMECDNDDNEVKLKSPEFDLEKTITEFDSKNNNADEERFLKEYFQLNIVLENLYKQWCCADKNFSVLSSSFDGVRMLRQDPVENLFSFICSQNNHISRISSMVEKLCVHYGDEICEIGGKKYHDFPSLSALSEKTVEGRLRELGFGYRAKFINQCAKYILDNHSVEWLCELRSVPYKEAHKALCELPGVGAKIADCVCLMSLDKPEAIPVDTHMWQIAQRDYLPHLKKYKTLTDKIYQEIGDHFRSIYGDFAGWAHSVLFSADLRRFRDLKEATKKPSSVAAKQKVKKEQVVRSAKKAMVSTSKSGKVLKRKSPRQTRSSKYTKHSR